MRVNLLAVALLGLGLGPAWLQACGPTKDDKIVPMAGGSAGRPSGGSAGKGGSGGTAGRGGSAGKGGTNNEAGMPSGGEAGQSGPAGAAGAAGSGEAGMAGSGVGGEGGSGGQPGNPCELPPTCTSDLSSVGAGDFSIAFDITTSAAAMSGVISQRATCTQSHFWDIRMNANGQIGVELDDVGANYITFYGDAIVNDGMLHEVQVCRKSGQLYLVIDDATVTATPSLTALSGLAALQTSTSVCTGVDPTVTLVGTIGNVCVGPL